MSIEFGCCAGLGRGSFDVAGSRDQYPADQPVVPRHVALDVRLDLEKKALWGTSSITLLAAARDVESVRLDAREMTVEKVTRDGKELRFHLEGGKLDVTLDAALPAGNSAVLVVHYCVEQPRLGLYFVAPDAAYPDKPRQAWTQSQDDDAPYWFPCLDAPNLKCTTEVRCTTDARYTVLSNGPRQSVTPNDDGTKTWHYKLDVPHAAYLVTLVAGEFTEISDSHGKVPVRYFVQPGREEDARRSFAKTPGMIAHFESLLGVPFAYPEYTQVAVADFVFGGMENTGCTTQTDRTLHDARAHLDFSSDELVAHELAHQWFGDLVTCRTWSEGWLNEGFATYFASLWMEKDKGKDEFLYDLWLHARLYFDEDGRRYRRPIVTRRYQEPIDLFDRHLYEKGARVLHMLRTQLGDAAFFGGIRKYLEKHGKGSVTTTDLCRALEDASGRSLERFFDDWVNGAGHPELTVEYRFDPDTKIAWLTVQQAARTEPNRPWKLDLPVVIHCGQERITQSFVLDEVSHKIPIRVPSRPTRVVLDPDDAILKTIKLKFPEEMLIATLKEDASIMARIRAIFALQDVATTGAQDALQHALLHDSFWGVRADAATALGEMRGERPMRILVDALGKVEHAKARRAIVRALGNWKHADVATRLKELLEKGDPSYFVEADAAGALGKTQDPRAVDTLKRILESRESWLDLVRAGCVVGLGETRELSAYDVVKAHAAYGKPIAVRLAAFAAMARLGSGRQIADEVARDLDRFSDERDFRVMGGLVAASEMLGSNAALPMLDRFQRQGPDGRIKRRAEEASRALRTAKPQELAEKLRDDVDKLREETRNLKDRLQALETAKQK